MESFVYQPDEGDPIEFPLLSRAEFRTVEGRMLADLRRQAKAIADELGLPAAQRAQFYSQGAYPKYVAPEDVDDWAGAEANAAGVLADSLRKRGVSPEDAEAIIERVPVLDRHYVARFVLGFLTLRPRRVDGSQSPATTPTSSTP